MSTKETGGAAFPTPVHNITNDGMTLRDYMAIHASNEDVRSQIEILRYKQIQENGTSILPDNWHVIARYMHADAMLEARK